MGPNIENVGQSSQKVFRRGLGIASVINRSDRQVHRISHNTPVSAYCPCPTHHSTPSKDLLCDFRRIWMRRKDGCHGLDGWLDGWMATLVVQYVPSRVLGAAAESTAVHFFTAWAVFLPSRSRSVCACELDVCEDV